MRKTNNSTSLTIFLLCIIVINGASTLKKVSNHKKIAVDDENQNNFLRSGQNKANSLNENGYEQPIRVHILPHSHQDPSKF